MLVALTAHAAADDHARFLAAGLDGVLVKPLVVENGLAAALVRAGVQERAAAGMI